MKALMALSVLFIAGLAVYGYIDYRYQDSLPQEQIAFFKR